jgi:hypothetical protein
MASRLSIVNIHIVVDNMLLMRRRGRRCLRIERHAWFDGSELGPLNRINRLSDGFHMAIHAIWMSTFYCRIDRYPSALRRSWFSGVFDFWGGWIGK